MIASGTLLSGKYRIESLLGRGGSGIVYAGRQEPLGRPVAIKVLRKDLVTNKAFLERFRREAEAAAALQHPNLVQVTDLVIEGEHVFLVMERLVGGSLSAVIVKDGALAQERLATIGAEILAGLSVAHAAGLVHRDVKPDNVFLQSLGAEDESAKLLDFGIVKRSSDDDQLTAGVIGTWQYMPPEQSRGAKVDGRADVYSLGASLFYAATGLRPHQAAEMERMTFVLSPVHAPPLATLRKDLDPAFCAVIDRALVKELDGRWAGANAMRAALAAFTRKRLPGKTGGTVRLTDAPRSAREGSQPAAVVSAAVATKVGSSPALPEEDSATIQTNRSDTAQTREEMTSPAVAAAVDVSSSAATQVSPVMAEVKKVLRKIVADDELETVKSPPIDVAKLDAAIAAAKAAAKANGEVDAMAETIAGSPISSASFPKATASLEIALPPPEKPRAPTTAPMAAPRFAPPPVLAPIASPIPPPPAKRGRSLFILAAVFVFLAALVGTALYSSLHK